jgi:hypothetical protein
MRTCTIAANCTAECLDLCGRAAAPDCKLLANEFGYVGAKTVFAHPVKVDDGLLAPAGLPQPSYLGYICEGKGEQYRA